MASPRTIESQWALLMNNLEDDLRGISAKHESERKESEAKIATINEKIRTLISKMTALEQQQKETQEKVDLLEETQGQTTEDAANTKAEVAELKKTMAVMQEQFSLLFAEKMELSTEHEELKKTVAKVQADAAANEENTKKELAAMAEEQGDLYIGQLANNAEIGTMKRSLEEHEQESNTRFEQQDNKIIKLDQGKVNKRCKAPFPPASSSDDFSQGPVDV
jgi:chromosome segregation ATPase